VTAAFHPSASSERADPTLLIQGAHILGVETSCDETAASVVRADGGVLRVLSTVISSQNAVHERFAGVVPELASRAHVERILPVVQLALEQARCTLDAIQAVAVGHRPGLIGSLLVGTAAAKALAWSRGIPLLGVDHVAAHLVAGVLNRPPVQWPALGLVVSGGHTHLFWMDGPCSMRVIGRTIDDAVGEAFDKAAVMLGLGYPGGPRLDAASDDGNAEAMKFPNAKLKDPLNFSFSGLKTSLLYAVRGVPSVGAPAKQPPLPLTPQRVRDLAASFQRAAVGQVIQRTERALAAHPAPTLLVGGGVTANRCLRAQLTAFAERAGVDLRLPEMAFCVDNAAMIAGLAHYRFAAGEHDPLWLAPCSYSSLAVEEDPAVFPDA
jgi:N6-L-threonylcarbamoyladenine synthase